MKESDARGISPPAPVFRVWICGPLLLERGDGTPVPVKDWGGSQDARRLLKKLLCSSGRTARREEALEALWPDGDPAEVGDKLSDAAYHLRKVLKPTPQAESLLLAPDKGGYRLPGQAVLWVDADAALALLTSAEHLGRSSARALPLVQEAVTYLSRGVFLEEEEGQWVTGRRATLERACYRSRLWLTEAYEKQGMPGEAEAVLSLLLEEDPTDEDMLCRLMMLLHRQGMTHQALLLYSHTCDMLIKEGVEPTEAMKALAIQLQEERHHTLQVSVDPIPSQGIIPLLKHAVPENTLLSQFTTALSQGIILAARALDKEEIHMSSTADSYRSQRKASLDILGYKRNIRLALHLHRTSTAQGLLQDINVDIQDLEQLERQARGHDLYCVKELLIANNLLATKIVKDQRQYEHAYRYANNAVRVAKSLEDGDLIATTKYTRGCVKLEWAQFGTVKQGILQLNKEKVQDAIRDFQNVLDMAHLQRTPLHPQLQGFTCLQLGRAYSLLHGMWDGSAETNPLTFVDQAESMVGCDSIEDAYIRLVITGTVSGLHWGAYHLNKTEIFIAMGMQDQALPELKRLRQLSERTYAQDETRNQAWGNVVMAEVLMGLEAYPEVVSTLRSALLACRSINSVQNTATIIDIHSRLAISSYGTSADVQELGVMLKEWHGIA